MLIDTVLETQQPERLSTEHSIRVPHLRYREILATHMGIFRPILRAMNPKVLTLIAMAIAVFCEDNAPVFGR
jgi:hypothetical protein